MCLRQRALVASLTDSRVVNGAKMIVQVSKVGCPVPPRRKWPAVLMTSAQGTLLVAGHTAMKYPGPLLEIY